MGGIDVCEQLINAKESNDENTRIEDGEWRLAGGSGTVGNITNILGGVVVPGASPGILTSSNATFSGANSDFTLDLNGPTPGTDCDQLNVRGTVSLGFNTRPT